MIERPLSQVATSRDEGPAALSGARRGSSGATSNRPAAVKCCHLLATEIFPGRNSTEVGGRGQGLQPPRKTCKSASHRWFSCLVLAGSIPVPRWLGRRSPRRSKFRTYRARLSVTGGQRGLANWRLIHGLIAMALISTNIFSDRPIVRFDHVLGSVSGKALEFASQRPVPCFKVAIAIAPSGPEAAIKEDPAK